MLPVLTTGPQSTVKQQGIMVNVELRLYIVCCYKTKMADDSKEIYPPLHPFE